MTKRDTINTSNRVYTIDSIKCLLFVCSLANQIQLKIPEHPMKFLEQFAGIKSGQSESHIPSTAKTHTLNTPKTLQTQWILLESNHTFNVVLTIFLLTTPSLHKLHPQELVALK